MRTIPISAVEDAATAVYAAAVRTPLVRLDVPVRTPDGEAVEIYLKLECLQPIGSFKLRGAYNAVRQLNPDQLKDGVWTVSAGNAAQGVAFAARAVGARCTVMVMDTAPDTKVRAVERLGATVVRATYDECWKTVETHASDRMRGYFVHPFDDDAFIAGNATAGLEILDDLPGVSTVVAAIGGGGLISGLAAVMAARRPDVRVVAAEPETASPLALSLAAGSPQRFTAWQSSFVDGAGGKSVLPSMWPLLEATVRESIVVTLDQAGAAMKLTAERLHVIIEGAAACAVAAALTGRAGGGKVVAVVSGGNIDLSRFAAIVGACPSA
ncbi:MAG: pyridoxal-phosphate dependent enzyme [Acidobacteriota bacterium]